jgi:hypothetical protein
MNGMKAKKERRQHAKRFTEEGLPRDGRDWTVQDWKDLYEGMEAIKAKIAQRHKGTYRER